jgi:signal recognition particle GTPase
MKPYLLQTLKELALLGAVENRVELSSLELANLLQTSQQTASRYLLELDKKGFITRELGIKKQIIMMVGLYGQGKTTTCGKLATYFKKKGLRFFKRNLNILKTKKFKNKKV